MPDPFSLGFRIKSGYAIAVAVAGTARSPVPVCRRLVELSDPAVHATRQPHHRATGKAQEDSAEISRLTKIIVRSATKAIAALFDDSALEGRRCDVAGLVVGSVIDPSTVGNPHIRAHASEGRLFRTVVERALDERGVTCQINVERTLASEASRTLGLREEAIKKCVAGWGTTLGPPWRNDEKSAATAAWMALV